MGYIIQRTNGTRDGLGDRVVFKTEEEAWEAAEVAFSSDPASDDDSVRAWLKVIETDEDPS